MRSKDYDETIERLSQNPIVIEMATEIPEEQRDGLTHEAGNPTFEFMLGANKEYADRLAARGLGPSSSPMHIGAIAETILAIRGWA